MAGTSIRIDVDGIHQVLAQLKTFDKQSNNLSDSFERIGNRVVADARMLVPFMTGALARSIRERSSKMRTTVIAGGPSTRKHGGGVYASIAHYGTYTHRSKGPRPFLTQAMEKNERHAERTIENQLEAIIRRVGLGP